MLSTGFHKTLRNNEFDYFIVSGSFEKFSINASTGEVYVTPGAHLDRETQDFYNITLAAVYHVSPALVGTAFVYVTVLDVNDVPPRFNSSSYSVALIENHIYPNVITCFASDADEDHLLEFNITRIVATNESGNYVDSSLLAVSIFVVSSVANQRLYWAIVKPFQ